MTIPREARSLNGHDIGRAIVLHHPTSGRLWASGAIVDVSHTRDKVTVRLDWGDNRFSMKPSDVVDVTGAPSPEVERG